MKLSSVLLVAGLVSTLANVSVAEPKRKPVPMVCEEAALTVIGPTGSQYAVCAPAGKRPVVFREWSKSVEVEGVSYVVGFR
jgi:hypothetical protein